MADSPNNFPLQHCEPLLHDLAYLQLRQSDTAINQQGIALVCAGGSFVGWIARQSVDIIRNRIQGGEILVGRIDQVETFYWANGGGQCKRGRLTLFSAD